MWHIINIVINRNVDKYLSIFVDICNYSGTFAGAQITTKTHLLRSRGANRNNMKRDSATASIILSKKEQKKRKDDRYPVKLRIYFDKAYKLYSIVYTPNEANDQRKAGNVPIFEPGEVVAMTEEEFNKTLEAKPKSGTLYAKNIFLTERRNRAIKVIESLGEGFTFEGFEAGYLSKAKGKDCIIAKLEEMESESVKMGKLSTATTYRCAYRSLQEFTGKQSVTFRQITPEFLKKYDHWMREPRSKSNNKTVKINSRTTISIYVRAFRAAWNRVKPTGLRYPFAMRGNETGYSIPKSRNVKKALPQSDVARIASFPAVDGSMEHRSRDLWIFSYLCNGLNFRDIAKLRWSDIDGDRITLIRSKTEDTTQAPELITIIITRQIGRIIDRWSCKDSEYVFGIINNEMTVEEQHKAVYQMIKNSNKYMKRICKLLELQPVTTYHARHSFATVLKNSGASVEFISESLGHKSISTTMNYLSSFEDEAKRKWANVLLPEPEEQ